MINLPTTILMLVEIERRVCSRELNLREIFLVLLVPNFNLYLCAMLEFCRIHARLRIKKEQKTRPLDAGENIPF